MDRVKKLTKAQLLSEYQRITKENQPTKGTYIKTLKHEDIFEIPVNKTSIIYPIKNGKKNVKILDEFYDVKAEIATIDSYSAHADYSEIIHFLSCQNKKKVKTIFLVHGDTNAKIIFKEKLIKEGFLDIVIPHKNKIIHLS